MPFFNENSYKETPKSPTIPFCTSPSQLQEMTMGQDSTFFGAALGLNTHSKSRPFNEIEEQLSNLKKENFNLKLRIYFLEEKMGVNFTSDEGNILKKNVELQTQVTNLKKEVQEKQELLCQAVKAMELEEEEYKKIIKDKEDQLQFYQQELEQLRMQLQDAKFDSDGISIKSDTTGFYSSRNMTDLQEKIKSLENELALEKENNASMQLILIQAEKLKTHCENLTKEINLKNDNIEHLERQLEKASISNNNLTEKIRELEEMLRKIQEENLRLQKKNRDESHKLDEVLTQMSELRKKYSTVKNELEKEQKRGEKSKFLNESKIEELEEDNRKQKNKIKELQMQLESALVEIRKNQNLAVTSSNLGRDTTKSNQPCRFSVQDAATPAGVATTHPSDVQIKSPKNSSLNSNPSSLSSSSRSPIKIDHSNTNLQDLQRENAEQKQKLIKLKSEQMQACSIIKSMMDSKKKDNDEIEKLKQQIKGLERELECVVGKPTREKGEGDFSSSTATSSSGDLLEKSMSAATTQCNMEELTKNYETLLSEREKKIQLLEAIGNQKDLLYNQILEENKKIKLICDEKENKIIDLEFELMQAFQANEILKDKDDEIKQLKSELKQLRRNLQGIVNKELWDKNKEIEKFQVKQTLNHDCKDEEIQALTVQIDNLKLELENCKNSEEKSREMCNLLSTRLEELAIFLDSLLKQKLVLGFLGEGKEKKLREIINNSLDLSRSFNFSMPIAMTNQSLHQLSDITSILNGTESEDNNDNVILSIVPENITVTYQDHLNEFDEVTALKQHIVNLETELKNVTEIKEVDDKAMNTTSKCQSEFESWSEPDYNISRQRIGLNKIEPEDQATTEDEISIQHSTTPRKKSSSLQISKLEIEIRVLTSENEKIKLELNECKNELETALSHQEQLQDEFEMKSKELVEDYNKKIQLLNNEITTLTRSDEISTLQNEIQLLKDKNEDIATERDKIKIELENAVSQHAQLQQEIKQKTEELNNEIATLKSMMECKEVELIQLQKELDEMTLQYSQSVLEKTKLANEKSNLEKELQLQILINSEIKEELVKLKREYDDVSQDYNQKLGELHREKLKLEMKLSELESNNAELHNKLIKLQNVESNEILRTSSPDLGIESDQGRMSSMELNQRRPLKETLELTESVHDLLCGDGDVTQVLSYDCERCHNKHEEMMKENQKLKLKIQSMKRALHETVNQLNLANQKKKEVEKTICKQIHKTSQVLRKAKQNLDSGSETDVKK